MRVSHRGAILIYVAINFTRYSRVADEGQKKRSKAFTSLILKFILDIVEL